METVLGSLLKAVGAFIHIGIMIYIWCIIIRAIISWINPDPYNPAVQFLYKITDPIFYRIRQLIPLDFGGIDFSPIILIFGLYFIDELTLSFFNGLSASLLGYQTFHASHVFAYFIKALAGIAHSILWILIILMIGRAIISFVNPDLYNPIVQFIYRATDPFLSFFQKRFPMEYGDFDFSPLVVLLLLYLLDTILVTTLYSAAMSFMF
jgi:YggT family protein